MVSDSLHCQLRRAVAGLLMPGGRGHNSRFPAAGPSLIDAVSHIPLIVGVTGHRDLVEAELPQIRRQVRRFFGDLQARYPDLLYGCLPVWPPAPTAWWLRKPAPRAVRW